MTPPDTSALLALLFWQVYVSCFQISVVTSHAAEHSGSRIWAQWGLGGVITSLNKRARHDKAACGYVTTEQAGDLFRDLCGLANRVCSALAAAVYIACRLSYLDDNFEMT